MIKIFNNFISCQEKKQNTTPIKQEKLKLLNKKLTNITPNLDLACNSIVIKNQFHKKKKINSSKENDINKTNSVKNRIIKVENNDESFDIIENFDGENVIKEEISYWEII